MRGGHGPALVNHFTLPRFWHSYGQLRPISRNGIRMRFLPIRTAPFSAITLRTLIYREAKISRGPHKRSARGPRCAQACYNEGSSNP